MWYYRPWSVFLFHSVCIIICTIYHTKPILSHTFVFNAILIVLLMYALTEDWANQMNGIAPHCMAQYEHNSPKFSQMHLNSSTTGTVCGMIIIVTTIDG